jgi:uncharacterized protein (DUF433 family)
MASSLPAISEKVHIASRPGVCGGRPCIAGSRIRVQDIYVWHEINRHSAEQIVADFPQLTLADVYAALAYFWDNRDVILADIEAETRLVDEMKLKHPSKLQEILKAGKNDGNPLSP